mmetsp:Transcript_37207/g.100596  ORF Transcript_37207/g.100596 Transcript_37207/m.100596 type:complete len:222 (-) Transcript_37207:807-1472(-)
MRNRTRNTPTRAMPSARTRSSRTRCGVACRPTRLSGSYRSRTQRARVTSGGISTTASCMAWVVRSWARRTARLSLRSRCTSFSTRQCQARGASLPLARPAARRQTKAPRRARATTVTIGTASVVSREAFATRWCVGASTERFNGMVQRNGFSMLLNPLNPLNPLRPQRTSEFARRSHPRSHARAQRPTDPPTHRPTQPNQPNPFLTSLSLVSSPSAPPSPA